MIRMQQLYRSTFVSAIFSHLMIGFITIVLSCHPSIPPPASTACNPLFPPPRLPPARDPTDPAALRRQARRCSSRTAIGEAKSLSSPMPPGVLGTCTEPPAMCGPTMDLSWATSKQLSTTLHRTYRLPAVGLTQVLIAVICSLYTLRPLASRDGQ